MIRGGAILFPEYQEMFKQESGFRAVEFYPDLETLKTRWKEVADKNRAIYESLTD